MSWVTASVNKRGTNIPTYFRLHRGHDHADTCELNFRTLMDGLRKADEKTVELRRKKFYLRLPGESIERVIQKTSNTTAKRTNAPSWAQTFTSAARIAKFLLEIADDAEFVNQLKIDYRDSNGHPYEIFWREFSFDATDQMAGVRYYNQLQARRFNEVMHPIALQMTLQSSPTSTRQGTKKRVAGSNPARLHLGTDSESGLEFAVYSANALNNVQVGDTILALGHGKYWKHEMNNVTEIRLDIDEPWQLTVLRENPN